MNQIAIEANATYYKKKYKMAANLYEQVLKGDPFNIEVLIRLSDCFYNTSENPIYKQKAIEISEKIIEIAPNVAKPYVIFSYFASNLSDQKKHAEKALMLEPDSSEALCCYGILLLHEEKYNEAISYLEKAILANPDLYLAHYNLLVAYAKRHDINNQLKQSKILLRSKPNLRNLIVFLSTFLGKNRILYNFLLITPFLYLWFPIKLLFIPHLFLISLYFYGTISSKKNNSIFYTKKNMVFIALILIVDICIMLIRWALQ